MSWKGMMGGILEEEERGRRNDRREGKGRIGKYRRRGEYSIR